AGIRRGVGDPLLVFPFHGEAGGGHDLLRVHPPLEGPGVRITEAHRLQRSDLFPARGRRAPLPAPLLLSFAFGVTRRARARGGNAERQSQHNSTSDSHRGLLVTVPAVPAGGASDVSTKNQPHLTGFLALFRQAPRVRLDRRRACWLSRRPNLAPTSCRSWSGGSCR